MTTPRKRKPPVQLTLNVVRSLPESPPGQKFFQWDREVRGFGAYRTSGGVVVFVYQYRMPYQLPRRAKIGELGELTPAQAREIARTWAYERRQGIDPLEKRRQAAFEAEAAERLFFRKYAEDYLERRRLEGKPLNQQHTRIVRNDVVGLLGDVRIDKMTTADIDRFLSSLTKRSKSARIYGLIYLKVILNDAKRRGVIGPSPADSYAIPPRVERERILWPDEIQRVVEACTDMATVHSDIAECVLRTVRRKTEVSAMRWEELDQETWRWIIPADRTKTKVSFSMYLPAKVVRILEKQQPDVSKRSGFVFTYNGERSADFSTQAKQTLDAHIHRRLELAAKAGLPPRRMEHWVVHDVRTTFGSLVTDEPLCIGSDVVELCLAHALGASKYQRGERLKVMRRAFEEWNDFIDSLMAREDAWPGGRYLPPLSKGDIKWRWKELRRDWPKRDGRGGPMKQPDDIDR